MNRILKLRSEYQRIYVIVFTLAVTIEIINAQNPNPSVSIDAEIQNEMSAKKFPGVSTIIVKGGKIVWVESYGFADIENNKPVEDSTIFLLASLSKVFTSTAAMQLYEKGTLDLDEDINHYLPWNVDIPNYINDSITFRNLMTHCSSIKDNNSVLDTYYDYPDPSISLADCTQRYFPTNGADYNASGNFLNSAPGVTYEYSNIGTALLGYLVEQVSGTTFNSYCNNKIFSPLCMNKTAWFMAELDSSEVARPYEYVGGNYRGIRHYGFADYPDGQLRSNVLDVGKFMLAYLSSGTIGTDTILSQSSIDQMWTLQIPELDAYQGLNWYQEELEHNGTSSLLWGHNGGESGASTDMYLDPTNKIGICVLTNGEEDALNISHILYEYALSLDNAKGITPICSGVFNCNTSTSTIDTDNKDEPSIITSSSSLSTQGSLEICNSTAEWIAKQSILLNNNFSVKLGSTLLMIIGECE